jgi:hypothetical protein
MIQEPEGGVDVCRSGILSDRSIDMAGMGRLPRRFPVGTRYVLEGVPGKEKGQLQVISRLVVLPDGTKFDLTHEPIEPRRSRRTRRRRPERGTKH